MVIIPDTGIETASAPPVKTDQLEAHIKDTLKSRAFPDIGVSVSKGGDAYLAGEVYSLNEVSEIAHIVHSVNGVNRVHFLHPDVLAGQRSGLFRREHGVGARGLGSEGEVGDYRIAGGQGGAQAGRRDQRV